MEKNRFTLFIVRRWVAACIMALGMALLVYMIWVEQEPGALPLLLLLVSLLWLVFNEMNLKKYRAKQKPYHLS